MFTAQGASPLAAAAAALWPERAGALLARAADPAAAADAAALATRPRAARLSALAAALLPPAPSAQAIDAAAGAERPRLRAVVRALGRARALGEAPQREDPPTAPLLARLAWERVNALHAAGGGGRATVRG